MLSLLFLAIPRGFLFQINVFGGSRAEDVLRQFFLFPDSIERVFNQGLNFAKFLLRPGLVYDLFCGSGAEVVLRPSFVS